MNIRKRKNESPPTVDLSIKHLAWAVIEAMPDSLIVTNPEGNIIYLNHAAEALLNITFSRAFGRPLKRTLTLMPVGPRLNIDTSHQEAAGHSGFEAARLHGYWLLQVGNDLRLINISVSSLPPDAAGRSNLLFSIRHIRGEGIELESVRQPLLRNSEVEQVEFHKRIVVAAQASQRWNVEHALIFLQLETGLSSLDEREYMKNALRRYVRRNDSCCMLESDTFAVLLEGYSIPQAIRRSFGLIRQLNDDLSMKRTRKSDLKIWIGLVPINGLSAGESARILGMAAQACQQAKKTGKPIAVQVYRHQGHMGALETQGQSTDGNVHDDSQDEA